MNSLFDKNCNLVGWVKNNRYIFDTKMNWVAFIVNKNVFSAETINWLGTINEYNCLDKQGEVVAWDLNHRVQGAPKPCKPCKPSVLPKPFKPRTPFKPRKPFRPYNPFMCGKWSKLCWSQWVNQ